MNKMINRRGAETQSTFFVSKNLCVSAPLRFKFFLQRVESRSDPAFRFAQRRLHYSLKPN